MKLWLTSSEIAELALPGMPTTKRNVNALAERLGWDRVSACCRQRAGRGGGLEYNVRLLPPAARAGYFGRACGSALSEAAAREAQAAPDMETSASLPAGLGLDARLAIIGAMKAFAAESRLTKTVAVSYFVDLYNLGRVDVAPWVREQIARLSTRTLLRWLAARADGEFHRLAVDRGAARRGKGVLSGGADGRIKAYALALVAHNPLYTTAHIRAALVDKFGETVDGKQMPGRRALEIALKAWKVEHANDLLAAADPDKFVSTTRPAGNYADQITRLNEQWQIDASPVDALCLDGRHSVYVCIDVWSRRVIVHISRTPRAEAVQLLLRKAILAWGVPERVKTDNGSDFVARATKRFFAFLDIEAQTSIAFSPWQKGVVERSIRTFQQDFSRIAPGFIGHSVADRKKIEQRRAFAQRLGTDDAKAFSVEWTGEQFQAEAERWANGTYVMRPHGGLDGATPFARAASWTQPIRRVEPEALAILLMQAPDGDGRRVVGKQGVRVDGFHYLAPGLETGSRVFVRLDPADKGRIYCFDESGETFLAEALCPELAGVDPAALIARVQAEQKALMAERSAAWKRERRDINSRTVLDAYLGQGEAAAANLVAFPQRSEAHTTPALDAGAEIAAMRRGEAPEPVPLNEDQERMLRLIQSDAPVPAADNVEVLHPEETIAQRFRRAIALEEALERGEPIATEAALWLGSYRVTGEYLGRKALFEDFGEAALR